MLEFITAATYSEMVFIQLMVGVILPFILVGALYFITYLLTEVCNWVTDSTGEINNPIIMAYAKLIGYGEYDGYNRFNNKYGKSKCWADMSLHLIVTTGILYYLIIFYSVGVFVLATFGVLYGLRTTLRVKSMLTKHIEDKKAHNVK